MISIDIPRLRGGSKATESRFHELMKEVAEDELTREGYKVYTEPSYPPLEGLSWYSYRPDLLAVSRGESESRLALVECETRPRAGRVMKKTMVIHKTLTVQQRLDARHMCRLLLIIPSGALHHVISLRRTWDIWVVSCQGEVVHKIPTSHWPVHSRVGLES